MEFTFTSSSASTRPSVPLAATTTPAASAASMSSQPAGFVFEWGTPREFGNQQQHDRVPLTKEHGVGSTTQWRKRIINQIENRIKDKRLSIQNARRTGLQQTAGPQESHPIPAITNTTAIAAIQDTTAISDEEERRIIAEVWESYKQENFEVLSQAFLGMTDKEIEDIEQDILQHRYAADYDPTYDMAVDMEENSMDQTIEQYMRLETSYLSVAQEDTETAAAVSLAMTLLSDAPCPRCHSRGLLFDSATDQSQAGGMAVVA
ncbi:hypothetical protein BGZ99_001126 [Dissophora globulifera]|uniref:Uncharacterized protein n=1 Tax=Dissophora globulifera TaxID=979702 RepID=A0A9P6RTU3_9FUNG|nr:hypothetical protein BGZ99_001126 [Dissophora globulifera]